MRAAVAASGIALLLAGCSEEAGPGADPVKRMFSAPYGGFIAAAGPHRSSCELALKAKGDGGKHADVLKTTVEVDEIGSFRILRGDSFELVHVGSIAWQRTEAKTPLKRMESGARPELLRDAGLKVIDTTGFAYDPVRGARLTDNLSLDYFVTVVAR